MRNVKINTNCMKPLKRLLILLITAWLFAPAGQSATTPVTLQIANETNGICAFTWTATKGQAYLVVYKTNLLQTNWTILTGLIASNNGVATGCDVMAAAPCGRFYRLSILSTNAADTQKPTLTIASPTANQQWSNSVFLVKGTAADNKQVAAVLYQTQQQQLGGRRYHQRLDQLDGDRDVDSGNKHRQSLRCGYQCQCFRHQQRQLQLRVE